MRDDPALHSGCWRRRAGTHQSRPDPDRIPADRRQRSIQIWSIAGSLGAAADPAIGGLLVQASWRWIFIINVPIGLAALFAAVVVAPAAYEMAEGLAPDLPGHSVGLWLMVDTAAGAAR